MIATNETIHILVFVLIVSFLDHCYYHAAMMGKVGLVRAGRRHYKRLSF
jgi:hypothetical protein